MTNPKLTEALSTVGICVKDPDGTVRYQNPLCEQACGNQVSKACGKGCMTVYSRQGGLPAMSEGTHLFRCEPIDGELFDLVIINDRRNLTTLFYPVKEKEEEQLRYLRQYGLSRREMEVMSLILRGGSKAEISRALFISVATLKTHLNNIYKKLPKDCSLDLKKRTAWKSNPPKNQNGAPAR